MTDCIVIKDLVVAAVVGVPEIERCAPQRLAVDAVFEGDFGGAGDDLARTVDYAAAGEWIRQECLRGSSRLIETLAVRLAEGLLTEFPAAGAVTIELRKFVLSATSHVAVRVRRERV